MMVHDHRGSTIGDGRPSASATADTCREVRDFARSAEIGHGRHDAALDDRAHEHRRRQNLVAVSRSDRRRFAQRQSALDPARVHGHERQPLDLLHLRREAGGGDGLASPGDGFRNRSSAARRASKQGRRRAHHRRMRRIDHADLERLEQPAQPRDVGIAQRYAAAKRREHIVEIRRMRRRAARLAQRYRQGVELALVQRYTRNGRSDRGAMLEFELARATVERHRDDRRFVEVGVIRRRPENRRDREPGRLLKHVGQRTGAERFHQRHQRAAEEPRLLPRRDDDPMLRRAPKTIGRCAARRDRRQEVVVPIRRHARSNARRVVDPLGAARRPRIPLRQLAGARRHGQRRPAERFGDDDRLSRHGVRNSSARACCWSFVVRFAARDRAGAIELFGEHQPRELVRERPRRQAEGRGLFRAHGVAQSERAADHESDVAALARVRPASIARTAPTSSPAPLRRT